MCNFIWFRTDLRLHDNYLLQQAANRGGIWIPVFIIDPELFKNQHITPLRLSFMAESLLNLRERLRVLGSDLVIVEMRPELFWETQAKHSELTVIASEDYTKYAKKRDNIVQKTITDSGGSLLLIKNNVVFDRDDELLTKQKDPIKVFTHFKVQWLKKLYAQRQILDFNYDAKTIFESRENIHEVIGSTQVSDSDLKKYFLHSEFQGGEDEALARWEAFKHEKIHQYNKQRDMLFIEGTSKLSPHYKWGTLSIYRVVRECIELLGPDFANFRTFQNTSKSGIESYLSELIWREFYKYILAFFPDTQTNNYNAKYDDVTWLFNQSHFDAWCKGETGYPIVDACMRQLNATGWMHNRGRMIVGSFLCKDLHIHWKYGEQYFREKLIDHDISSNNGGWQWIAGTGTDAAPYFRIFNPAEQSKKFDPSGSFIRKYIPELTNVPDTCIHTPHTMSLIEQSEAKCIIGKDYPAPIVDHAVERKRTLELYKTTASPE